MNIKIILKKLAEINNKADKNHRHDEINAEIILLKERVASLEKMSKDLLYFEEIKK